MRQKLIRWFDPKRGQLVSTLAWEYTAEYQIPVHAHGSDQLVYATRGVMEITADRTRWVIPPQFAIWIPAHQDHSIWMPQPVSMRTLYLRSGLVKRRGPQCSVIHVTALFRELIVEAVRRKRLRESTELDQALTTLIVDQIQRATPMPSAIPLPKDPRAVSVAEEVLAHPGGTDKLPLIAFRASATVRTIQRIFLKELGMSFEEWRKQVRLMKALELLASGNAVKQTAHEVGYKQTSAFVTMFRETLGTTPKAWVMERTGTAA